MSFIDCYQLDLSVVDWSALGTWAGAVATAVAVYLAATLAERQRHRDIVEAKRTRYHVLAGTFEAGLALVEQLDEAAQTGAHGIGIAPPSAEEFDAINDVLGSAPLFEFGDGEAAQTLLRVKRLLVRARSFADFFETANWDPYEVQLVCRHDLLPVLQYSATAARQSARNGRWHWRNSAGEWMCAATPKEIRQTHRWLWWQQWRVK